MFQRNPNLLLTPTSISGLTLSLGQVDHDLPIYFLKIHSQNGFRLNTAYRIDVALSSLFMDNDLNMKSAVHHRYQKNDVVIFFTCERTKVSSTLKLLLSEMTKKPLLRVIANTPLSSIEQGTTIFPERLRRIAEAVLEPNITKPLIIELRSGIFYDTFLANVTTLLIQEQQQAITQVKRTKVSELLAENQNSFVDSDKLAGFINRLSKKLEKIKQPKERFYFRSALMKKARKAYTKDKHDKAIRLYEECLTNHMSRVQKVEAYYELHCLYDDKNNYRKMLQSLTNCYSLFMDSSNYKSKYYLYWEKNIRISILDKVNDFYISIKNDPKLDKQTLLEILYSYQAIKLLINKKPKHLKYYQHLSSELLKLLISKLEEFCSKTREEIESLLVIEQESSYKKGEEEKDILKDLLVSEFEYKPEYTGGFEPPQDRPNFYEKHTTSFEEDLGITPTPKPKKYIEYCIRQQQPYAKEIRFAKDLFHDKKYDKRLPAPTAKMLLPTPEKPDLEIEKTTTFINPKLKMAMKVADEVMTPNDLEKYIERLFTEYDKTKRQILDHLTTFRPSAQDQSKRQRLDQRPNKPDANRNIPPQTLGRKKQR